MFLSKLFRSVGFLTLMFCAFSFVACSSDDDKENTPPTDIALSATAIDENKAIGSTVGNFTTTDATNGDTFTYSLVSGDGSDDNGDFTIDKAVLKTAKVFDFETKNSYKIRVRSTDSAGGTFDKKFTITINKETFEITSEGKEYKIKSIIKKGSSDMEISNPAGEVKVEKSGSNYKVSVKDLGGQGASLMGTSEKLTFDFEATLKAIKAKESYEIKFAKKSDITKSIPFAFTITITEAVKQALNLPSVSPLTIELENTSKMAELKFSVEEPTEDAKKVSYDAKKYAGFLTKDKLEVGVRMVSTFKATLTNAELIASVKNTATKELLQQIMAYTSSSSLAERAKKTALTGVLDSQRTALGSGTIGDTTELVLKFEKK